VVSTPSKVDPLKNSTFEMTPAAPVAVRSEAVAAKVVWDPNVRLLPLAGEVKFTVGTGFMGAGVGLGVGVGVGEGFGVVVEENPFTTNE
jgi:hypothetical protein